MTLVQTTARPLARRVRRRLGRLRRHVREPVMALVVAGVVEVGLRHWRLPALARLLRVDLRLDGAAPAALPATVPTWTVEAVRATDSVLRHWPFGDTCLRRALVLGNRLHRLHPVLRVGVRPATGPAGSTPFEAHAWLEIGGRTLDPSARSFAVLADRAGRP